MNKRSIELYTQALEFAYTTVGKDHSDTTYFQGTVAGKFAELIVQECIQAIQNEGQTYEHIDAGEFQANNFSQAVRQHFGVE